MKINNFLKSFLHATMKLSLTMIGKTNLRRKNMAENSINMPNDVDVSTNNDLVIETENFFVPIVARLKASEAKLEKLYPGIFGQVNENKTANLVNNIFPLGLPKSVYVSCLPQTANAKDTTFIVYRFRVIRTPNDYLSRFLPDNRTITFNAIFKNRSCGIKIQDLSESLARPCCINEIEFKITPQNYNSRINVRLEFLTEIQTRAIKVRNNINAHLNLWREYLDWLEALCVSQMRGFRYNNYTVDENNDLLLFSVLFKNEKEAEENVRYLRNNNIVAADLEASSEPDEFKYNQASRRRPTGLGKFNSWDKEGTVVIDGKEYFLAIFRFDRDNSWGLPPREGFLTVNIGGDFNLINIQRNAINRLLAGNSNSAELIDWLFNPENVKCPEKIEPITVTDWNNKDIEKNENQRQAVEKMLAAPSLFLLQGPPGTGKTTVIAEAIYQFNKMGKTVFLTSQSNDAVDNALERLALDTAVRSLRMEKNRNRNDEENDSKESADSVALRRFFKSWAKGINSEWLDKWSELDSTLAEDQKNLRDAELAIKDSTSIAKSIENLFWQKDEAEKTRNAAIQNLNSLKMSENNHMNSMINTEIYSKCLSGDFSNQFVFDENTNDLIISMMRGLVEKSAGKGLRMLKSSIDSAFNNESKNNLLNELVKNYGSLASLIENLRSNSSDTSSVELEANLLKEKRELSEKVDEYLSNGEEIPDEIQVRYRSIGYELANLKKTAGIKLSETDKALLSSDLLENFNVKNILPVLIEIHDEFKKAFDSTVSSLKINLKKDNQQEKTEAEEKLRIAEGHLSEINDQYNKAKSEHKAFSEKISEISKQYFKEKNNDNEKLIQAIKARIIATQQELNKNSSIRKPWEKMLNGLVNRLNNVTNEKKPLDSDVFMKDYKRACNVVGMTCTGNTKSLTESEFTDFDVVIVDEVSKATPTELLIPLLLGRKVILVGDHRQLPPMFKEQERSYMELIDDTSKMPENTQRLLTQENFVKFKKMVTSSVFKTLFERAPEPIKHTLLTQYRMHSDIMSLINNFYENKLICGVSDGQKNHGITIKDRLGNVCIRPDQHAYWFDSSYGFDGKSAYENFAEGSTSAFNPLEVEMVIKLLIKIAEDCKTKGVTKTVGIISFYQRQINEIRCQWRKISKSYRPYVDVDINTVDRFQGKEKNIIIASLVRNNPAAKVSKHIVAYERINVAFSRAQELLAIVGAEHIYRDADVELPKMDAVGVETSKVYRKIISDLKARNCFFDSSYLITKK